MFASITPPQFIQDLIPASTDTPEPGDGLIAILNLFLRLLFITGGLVALWKLIEAGFTFMNSSGEAKALSAGRDKLVLALTGLLIMASATVVAGIAGMVAGRGWTWILQPVITLPTP